MGSSPATAAAIAGPAGIKRGPSAMSNVGTPNSLQNALLDVGNLGTLVAGTPGGGIITVPTTTAPTRDMEAMRARKMAEIVELLGTRWGLVSQEGVERCAKRLGLECLWEDPSSTQRTLGERTLSIAGNGLLVDIEFKEQEVRKVVLSFPGSGEGWGKGIDKGAAILLQDLRGEGGYVKLEKFAKDLGGLAALDALGKEGISCFDALEGIGGALEKVWIYELEDGDLEAAENENREIQVMCEKNGRPRMHEDGVMGLRLDYWVSKRFIPSSRQSLPSAPTPPPITTRPSKSMTYSLELTCQSHLATLYPCIRISASWLGDPTSKNADMTDDLFGTTSTTVLNWLEPAPTYVTESSNLSLDMNLDGASDPLLTQQPQLPNIRFVARVEPPVVLPLQVAVNLFAALGAPMNQDPLESTLFISLLLPNAKVDTQQTMTLPPPVVQPLRSSKRTQSFSEDGTPRPVLHAYSFLKPPPEYGRLISEIPFAHPNQLLMALQVLRQWVLVGTYVTNAFTKPSTLALTSLSSATQRPATPSQNRPQEPSSRHKSRRHKRANDSYTDSDTSTASDTDSESSDDDGDYSSFSPASSRSSSSTTNIQRITHDVQLTLSPAPRFATITTTRGDASHDVDQSGHKTAAVSFEVRDNAEIAIIELNLGKDEDEEDEDDEEEERQKARTKRVLEVSEDLGVWGNWITNQL